MRTGLICRSFTIPFSHVHSSLMIQNMCLYIFIFHRIHITCTTKLHKIRVSQQPQLTMSNGDKAGECLYGNDQIYRDYQSSPSCQKPCPSQDEERGRGGTIQEPTASSTFNWHSTFSEIMKENQVCLHDVIWRLHLKVQDVALLNVYVTEIH